METINLEDHEAIKLARTSVTKISKIIDQMGAAFDVIEGELDKIEAAIDSHQALTDIWDEVTSEEEEEEEEPDCENCEMKDECEEYQKAEEEDVLKKTVDLLQELINKL